MPFSGIIEEMGTVTSLLKNQPMTLWDGSKSEGTVLKIACQTAIIDTYIGASIAVMGTCLTVTTFDDTSFTVNVAPESLRCTCLGDLKMGSRVNLERAMKVGDRNSGHNVQGHVDEAGTILKKEFEGESLWVRIKASSLTLPFIVHKGYIAVDGTSLTVCEVHRDADGGGWFSLMLIPHTQQCIVLPSKAVGDRVNLEVDVLGKYAAESAQRAVDTVAAQATDLKAQVTTLQTQVKVLFAINIVLVAAFALLKR